MVATWCGSAATRDSVRRSASHVANGLPAVTFDGDDYIWANGSTEFGTVAGGKTMFVVVRVDTPNNGYVFDGSTVSGRNALFTGQQADPGRWHVFTGQSPVTVGPTVDATVFQVHSVVLDDAANEHFLNGALDQHRHVGPRSTRRADPRRAVHDQLLLSRRHRGVARLRRRAQRCRPRGRGGVPAREAPRDRSAGVSRIRRRVRQRRRSLPHLSNPLDHHDHEGHAASRSPRAARTPPITPRTTW